MEFDSNTYEYFKLSLGIQLVTSHYDESHQYQTIKHRKKKRRNSGRCLITTLFIRDRVYKQHLTRMHTEEGKNCCEETGKWHVSSWMLHLGLEQVLCLAQYASEDAAHTVSISFSGLCTWPEHTDTHTHTCKRVLTRTIRKRLSYYRTYDICIQRKRDREFLTHILLHTTDYISTSSTGYAVDLYPLCNIQNSPLWGE